MCFTISLLLQCSVYSTASLHVRVLLNDQSINQSINELRSNSKTIWPVEQRWMHSMQLQQQQQE